MDQFQLDMKKTTKKVPIPKSKKQIKTFLQFAASTTLQVTFNDNIQIKYLYTWSLAHLLARKSDWIQIVADRHRFQRRITQLEDIIAPILQNNHRNKIINRNTQF